MSARLVRDSLIDFKEVAVHGTHGNAVVNHTLCVLMVDISITQKPHFLPLFWSSLTTGACRLLRPRFVVYEDRHLVQEKLSFDCWCKGTKKKSNTQECARHLNKLFFLGKNGRMYWIEKRSFGHGHVRSKSFSGALGHPII